MAKRQRGCSNMIAVTQHGCGWTALTTDLQRMVIGFLYMKDACRVACFSKKIPQLIKSIPRSIVWTQRCNQEPDIPYMYSLVNNHEQYFEMLKACPRITEFRFVLEDDSMPTLPELMNFLRLRHLRSLLEEEHIDVGMLVCLSLSALEDLGIDNSFYRHRIRDWYQHRLMCAKLAHRNLYSRERELVQLENSVKTYAQSDDFDEDLYYLTLYFTEAPSSTLKSWSICAQMHEWRRLARFFRTHNLLTDLRMHLVAFIQDDDSDDDNDEYDESLAVSGLFTLSELTSLHFTVDSFLQIDDTEAAMFSKLASLETLVIEGGGSVFVDANALRALFENLPPRLRYLTMGSFWEALDPEGGLQMDEYWQIADHVAHALPSHLEKLTLPACPRGSKLRQLMHGNSTIAVALKRFFDELRNSNTTLEVVLRALKKSDATNWDSIFAILRRAEVPPIFVAVVASVCGHAELWAEGNMISLLQSVMGERHALYVLVLEEFKANLSHGSLEAHTGINHNTAAFQSQVMHTLISTFLQMSPHEHSGWHYQLLPSLSAHSSSVSLPPSLQKPSSFLEQVARVRMQLTQLINIISVDSRPRVNQAILRAVDRARAQGRIDRRPPHSLPRNDELKTPDASASSSWPSSTPMPAGVSSSSARSSSMLPRNDELKTPNASASSSRPSSTPMPVGVSSSSARSSSMLPRNDELKTPDTSASSSWPSSTPMPAGVSSSSARSSSMLPRNDELKTPDASALSSWPSSTPMPAGVPSTSARSSSRSMPGASASSVNSSSSNDVVYSDEDNDYVVDDEN